MWGRAEPAVARGTSALPASSPDALVTFRSLAGETILSPGPKPAPGLDCEGRVSLLNQASFLPGLYRPNGRGADRRLGVARHADGTDALGWVLLGFLLGAAAAVATMMHAELPRHAAAAPAAAPRPAYIAPLPRPEPAPAVVARRPASVRPVIATPAQPAPAAATVAARAPAGAASTAEDDQVADDAAAAGMTSRRGAPAPRPAGDQALY